MNEGAVLVRPWPASEAPAMAPPRSGGSVVLRLRTETGAPVRGHALLIGAPLAGLRGVPECIATMRGWLETRGFCTVGEPTDSDAASIEAQMHAVLDAVEPGDWVLVYYAGHGMQVMPAADLHPRPLAVLMPMDTFESEVVIAADTWMGWIEALSKKVAPTGGDGPGVALVLDCCHAQALMERWPRAEARAAIMAQIRQGLRAQKLRDPADPLPGVVRVLATGRDERADVGEMTTALVRRLRAHPDEPWWALMDRLRVSWAKAQQHPGVTGPSDRVPLSAERFVRPVGLMPCAWRGGAWTVEHATSAGMTSHRRLALTPSLRVPAQAWAELDVDGARLRVLDPAGGWPAGPEGFAWAWPAPQARRAMVVVDGEPPRRRHDLMRRLDPLVRMVFEQAPSGDMEAMPGLVRFVARGTTVEIHDRWGDRVAQTSRHDQAAWEAWLDRLLSLDEWLAVAERGSPWPEGALRLRWGTWDAGGASQPWPEGDSRVPASTPLWVAIEAQPWVRAHVSLFRIRADRAVDWVSACEAGGLPLVGGAAARVGTHDDPLRFALPHGVAHDESRTEVLVALVCDRPISLSLLARGPVGSPAVKGREVFRGDHASPLRLAMLTQSYRICPASPPSDDRGEEIEAGS